MLVLKRSNGQRILVGKDIVITQLQGGRIGIDAPPEITIHREEVAARIAAGERKEKA